MSHMDFLEVNWIVIHKEWYKIILERIINKPFTKNNKESPFFTLRENNICYHSHNCL